MAWNYRIFEEIVYEERVHSLREVYYDSQGELEAYSEEAVGLTWEPEDGETLGRVLELVKEATKKPLLRAEDFER